jgi:hypothetical protein
VSCRKTRCFPSSSSGPSGYGSSRTQSAAGLSDLIWQSSSPQTLIPVLDNQPTSNVILAQKCMPDKKTDLIQGTLDLLILKTVAHGPIHGCGIAGGSF